MSQLDSELFYNQYIEPFADDVSNKIKSASNGLEKEFSAISFSSFLRNTMALFEIINKSNCTDIFIMTLRLLMEISADVNFIANNPSSISDLATDVANINSEIDRSKMTIAKLAERMQNLRLVDATGEKTKTTDRVKLAFNEKRFKNLYDYYCCYSHSNIAAIIMESERRLTGDNAILLHSLDMLAFYPDIAEMIAKSIGTIIHDKQLKNTNLHEMREVIRQCYKCLS